MTKMTVERAMEIGGAWNSGDAKVVASYFTEDGTYCASVGPDQASRTFTGRAEVQRGVQAFFDRFPSGKFENLIVRVSGDIGSFEWDFVVTDPKTGAKTSTPGCDLLEFRGDLLKKKNAFRKATG